MLYCSNSTIALAPLSLVMATKSLLVATPSVVGAIVGEDCAVGAYC